MTEKLFHVGIKALVTDHGGKILLLKVDTSHFRTNATEHWDIPGGRMQTGQSVEETLQREVEEEIGLAEIGQISFFTAAVSNIEIPVSESEKVGLVLMVYRVKPPKVEQIVLSEEHTAYEWVSPKIAAQRLQYKYPAEFTEQISRL